MLNTELRKLTHEDVSFHLKVEQDHIPVRGNAISTGNTEEDRKVEDEIIARLEQGDVWAWALVTVTAEWNGHKAHTYLGACSYKDEENFKSDAYYADMKTEALENLNEELKNTLISLSPLLTKS